jgi:Fe-S cluster assembly protein SufB
MNKEVKNLRATKPYAYGFHEKDISTYTTGKGLSEDVIRAISEKKSEPAWMLDYRLKAYKVFLSKKHPTWGPNLDFLKYDEYTYFIRNNEGVEQKWEDVPDEIKNTFERIGIPEAERKYLAGVTTQYESEAVYHNMLQEVIDKGVIFTDTDTALKEHPEIFKKYFGTVVPYADNKFSALNSAVWSGGSFIYVPKGVKLDKPLQSYFRINSERMGQFERTLIIVDEGAEITYVEGCTAPVYKKDSLHAAVVEIIVHKDAVCRYTTIQNWSNNVVNLVTKRAYVKQNGLMEWIDGNIGSLVNMKYPSVILAEPYAKGTCISIAVAGAGQIQDAGAKMIHLAPNTSSTIVSKSIVYGGGTVNYRGLVKQTKNATNSKTHVECDTLLLDDKSKTDTIPHNICENNSSMIEHEAKVSRVSEEQLFYLMSRGLTEEQATEMIVLGFIEPFSKELPMEYAIELNQLLKLSMEGSVG